MSEERRLKGFGAINDQSEELKPKEGGGSNLKFGLNQNARLIKFEYNPKASSDGSPTNAIDVNIKVGESTVMARFFEITKVYNKDLNKAVEDDGSQAWADAFNEEMIQLNATITHIVKATGVTQDQINKALAKEVGFVDYAKIMASLANVNAGDLDVCLQYQWNIPTGKDRTYLELPKNMKGGYFLVPHQEPKGEWVEQTEWDETVNVEGTETNITKKGLRYVDSEDDKNIHPFIRNENFMDSNKAVQQTKNDQQQKPGVLSSASSGINSSAPTKSGWDS